MFFRVQKYRFSQQTLTKNSACDILINKQKGVAPMSKLSLQQHLKRDFTVRFLDAMTMPQRKENPPFFALGRPKKQDMILFVSDCSTRYLTKDGEVISTQSGDVVYVPRGSEYRVDCIENSASASTFQINFLLFDENFEPFILSDRISVFTPKSGYIRTLFEKSVLLGNSPDMSFSLQKSVLYEILHAVAKEHEERRSEPLIEKGISYLNTNFDKNPSVEFLASMCHISEEYFRKLFKKETGVTPSEYKNALRMKKAQYYLLYSELSVFEIAELLSFATASHFIKRFRENVGSSPSQYRKAARKNM